MNEGNLFKDGEKTPQARAEEENLEQSKKLKKSVDRYINTPAKKKLDELEQKLLREEAVDRFISSPEAREIAEQARALRESKSGNESEETKE